MPDCFEQSRRTNDSKLLVASPEELLATKLKAILDRAEAKDYLDISAMLSAGISLERALGAFAKMYGKDPGLVLRAIGYFKDGDLPSLPQSRSGHLARGKRPRCRNSGCCDYLWIARGGARRLRHS